MGRRSRHRGVPWRQDTFSFFGKTYEVLNTIILGVRSKHWISSFLGAELIVQKNSILLLARKQHSCRDYVIIASVV